MRLLNVTTLELHEFNDENRPQYVTASHRWIEGCETTFKDFRKRRNTESAGYQKVEAFAKYVRDNTSLEWLWVDTCCINKSHSAELSEAVNLMYKWYRDAEMCIAYLADVETPLDKRKVAASQWFQRGWTLQELLAPRVVVFVTSGWQIIGRKGGSFSSPIGMTDSNIPRLEEDISKITGIPEQVLHDSSLTHGLSKEVKLKWMDNRRTTRPEDMFYALYGIFGVAPGTNYGEGYDLAKLRLLTAIQQQKSFSEEPGDFREIRKWLSAPNSWRDHETAHRRCEPQTGTWFLQCAQYQSWKNGQTRHLWLYGKAGCGKTVLCSIAIQDIHAHCHEKNAACGVFFFSFSDSQKQSYYNLLRSLVVQLARREPGLSKLREAYDNRQPSTMPTENELMSIISTSINSYETVYLLLDALDECPEEAEARQALLDGLEQLTQTAPKLRIMATSRELRDVRAVMGTIEAESVSVTNGLVNSDIQKHIRSQLCHARNLCQLDSTTKVLIETTLTEKADGMFRWVYCQLQALKQLKSTRPKYIRKTLDTLPATLDATYERILCSIEEMYREEAVKLLQWLAYANKPLSLRELGEASIIDVENGIVDENERNGPRETFDILAGLIVIQADQDEHTDEHNIDESDDTYSDDTESGLVHRPQDDRSSVVCKSSSRHIAPDWKIRLAHFSVKEYLESSRILQSASANFHLESAVGHRHLSQSCLVYLDHCLQNSRTPGYEEDLVTFPLVEYAANFWHTHSAQQSPQELSREIALLRSRHAREVWLLHLGFDMRLYSERIDNLDVSAADLYEASQLGLEAVVCELLRTGSNVNGSGGLCGVPLQGASCRGHLRIVRILIDAGADVNACGGVLKHPLTAALRYRHGEVAQTLIDAGSDICLARHLLRFLP